MVIQLLGPDEWYSTLAGVAHELVVMGRLPCGDLVLFDFRIINVCGGDGCWEIELKSQKGIWISSVLHLESMNVFPNGDACHLV